MKKRCGAKTKSGGTCQKSPLVNYTPFKKNKLIKRDDLVIPEGNNEHGMTIRNRQVHNKVSRVNT